jgi:hypothetical protein
MLVSWVGGALLWQKQGNAELEALAGERRVEVVGPIELGLLPQHRLLGAPLLMRTYTGPHRLGL